MKGRVGLGWLVTYRNMFRLRESNPDTSPTTTPRRQPRLSLYYKSFSCHWQTAWHMLNFPYHVHMVIKPLLLLGLAAEYRSRRWVWSAVVRRPSEVYDTHRRTRLTAPETISRSGDMVKNRRLNLPHVYLAPPLGMTCLEFLLDFWHQKTKNAWAIIWLCLCDPRFSHLSRTPDLWQTDRWTDKRVPFYHSVMRVKNWCCADVHARIIDH